MDRAEKRSDKSFVVTWVLSLLVGYFGVDRFYLGKIGTGILKLITFGGVGVWWFVDLVILLCDGARDKKGMKLAEYDKNKMLAIIVTVAVLVAGGAFGATRQPAPAAETPAASQPESPQPETPAPENEGAASAEWDMEAAYAKVANGMTKAEVEKAVGKPSESCTESEDPTFGKTEICTYGNAFIDKGAITVTFQQDKVSSKTKSTY